MLLAGGKSRRMLRDKTLLEMEGVPLWQRQLRLLKELQPHEIFIAGPSRADWESADCVVIADLQPDAGPLSGLAAGLRRSSSAFLLALAVDLPRMTSDYLRGLLPYGSDEMGCVPHLSDRFEPLAAVYPRPSLRLAERGLKSGDYSLQHFVARCVSEGLVRPKEIAASEEHLFLNLNTLEDLQAVRNG